MDEAIFKTDVASKNAEREKLWKEMEAWEKKNSVTKLPGFTFSKPLPSRNMQETITACISQAKPGYIPEKRPPKPIPKTRELINADKWAVMKADIIRLIDGKATYTELSIAAGLCSSLFGQVSKGKRVPSISSAYALHKAAKRIAGVSK